MKTLSKLTDSGHTCTKWRITLITINPILLKVKICVTGYENQAAVDAKKPDPLSCMTQIVKVDDTNDKSVAWAEGIVTAKGGVLEGAV